jgi:hypothetical protein
MSPNVTKTAVQLVKVRQEYVAPVSKSHIMNVPNALEVKLHTFLILVVKCPFVVVFPF